MAKLAINVRIIKSTLVFYYVRSFAIDVNAVLCGRCVRLRTAVEYNGLNVLATKMCWRL